VLSGGNQRNVLTLTPPLTISEKELLRATDILSAVLRKCSIARGSARLAEALV